jgi:hypothetical protein
VLDDAFADSQRQVQSAKSRVPFLEPGNNAQRVKVVVKSQTMRLQGLIQGLLARVTEWRVANVMDQRESFGQLCIQAQNSGKSSSNLCDFKRVREPAPEVV